MLLLFLSKLLALVKKYLTVIFLIICLILILNKPVFSQSITGINAEVSSLRTRISRLEAEVRNLQRTNFNSAPGIPKTIPETENNTNPTNNPPTINNRAVGRSDPLFERLATLVVELKEDVQNLDTRLKKLEQQNVK